MSPASFRLRQPPLVITATEIEAAPLRARLGTDADVGLLVVGVGHPSEPRVAEALRSQVGSVVALGLAGGLAPGLQAGDVVLADAWRSAVPPHVTRAYPTPAAVDVVGRALGAAGLRISRGPAISVDAPFHGTDARDRLHEASGALAVDMEDARWAALARAAGADFVSVRVISDRADRRLPRPRHEILDATGAVRWGRWLMALRGGRRAPIAALRDILAARREWRAAMASLEGASAALAALLGAPPGAHGGGQ